MEVTPTNTTIVPVNMDQRILDSVLYEPRLIINIISHVGIDPSITVLADSRVEYLAIYTLLVCKKWTTVLYNAAAIGDSNLAQAVSHAYIPAIPAAYYDLLSLEQKVTLSNRLIYNSIMIATTLKPQYRMKWDVIVSHCQSNPPFARWVLGTWKCKEKCQYNLNKCVVLLFKYFESYRSHIYALADCPGTSLRVMCDGMVSFPEKRYIYQHHDVYGDVLVGDIYFVCSSADQREGIITDAKTILNAAMSIAPAARSLSGSQ